MAYYRATNGGGSGGLNITSDILTLARTDNWSSYKTMIEFTTLSSVNVEVESYFNGASTGTNAYARQYIIDGVTTSIPTSPNIQTITIPAGKTCQLQQTTGGNNYSNQIRLKFS